MAHTLVIREVSGEVVEMETSTALDRVKSAGAVLLSSEDAQRHRSGTLSTRSVPGVGGLLGAFQRKRGYKRRDKRAEE